MTTDLNEMARTGCFVSVHVQRPMLRTSLTWKDLGLPELDDKIVTPPSTRPPSEAYNEFSKLEGRMRNCLKQHSAGSAGGFRFVRFNRLGKFLEEIEPFRKAYEDAVDPFLAKYDQAVSDALAIWEARSNEIFDSLKEPPVDRSTFCRRISGKLQRSWPSADKLRDRFRAEVQVLQFTVPSEEVFEADQDLILEARQKARSTLNGFFAEAQNELRERAINTVRRMHKVLVEGETITERSIKPLKAFVEQFRELSVVNDSEFRDRLEGLVAQIENRGSAEGLRNNPQAWDEITDLLQEVADTGQQLVEEATARRLDHSQRRISI